MCGFDVYPSNESNQKLSMCGVEIGYVAIEMSHMYLAGFLLDWGWLLREHPWFGGDLENDFGLLFAVTLLFVHDDV